MANTMNINLKLITAGVQAKYKSIKLIKSTQEDILGARLWNSDALQVDTNHVYICKPSEVETDFPENMSFILLDKPDERFAKTNYALISDKVNVMELFQDVQQVIETVRIWHRKMLESVIEKCSLEELIEISSSLFKDEIFIFDPCRRTLAKSSAILNDPSIYFIKNIDGAAYLNSYAFDKITKVNRLKSLEALTAPTYINGKEFLFPFIVSNVWSDCKRLAMLVIVDNNNSFSDFHLQLCEHLTQCIGYVIERNIKITQDAFLLKMIQGKPIGKNEVIYNLGQLGWEQSDTYAVLVIQQRHENKSINNSNEIISFLKWPLIKRFPDIQVLSIEDRIVIIANINNSIYFKRENINEFIEVLKMGDLVCGMSMLFENFMDLRAHYQQAIIAVNFANSKANNNPIAYYEDHILDHLISTFADKYEIVSFIHPAIKKLAEHDRDTGSNLVDSLYQYLIQNKSYIRSSKQLHIHKSTLTYRLRQIIDITSLDLDDEENNLCLIMSIRMLWQSK